MNQTTKIWLKGMLVGMISAAASTLSGIVVLPEFFNFSRAGVMNTIKLVTVPVIVSVCLYLKKSPLPERITATVDNKGNISDVSGTVEVSLKGNS